MLFAVLEQIVEILQMHRHVRVRRLLLLLMMMAIVVAAVVRLMVRLMRNAQMLVQVQIVRVLMQLIVGSRLHLRLLRNANADAAAAEADL